MEQAKAKQAKPGTIPPQIKELQRERVDALTERADSLTKPVEKMSGEFEELIEARRLLLQAELEVAKKESERITLYKKTIDTLKDYEVWANARVQAGRGTAAVVLGIKARRLELEIQLEQAKAKEAKEAAVTAILSVAPAAKEQTEELQKERIATLEKFVDQLTALTQKIKELQKERIAVLKKQIDQLTKLYQDSRLRYEEVLEATRLLAEAELDVAETDTERVELYKSLTDVFGQLEDIAEAREQAGRGLKPTVLGSKAKRLEATIQLERVKMRVAKEETIHPRPPGMIPPRPADMLPPRPPE